MTKAVHMLNLGILVRKTEVLWMKDWAEFVLSGDFQYFTG